MIILQIPFVYMPNSCPFVQRNEQLPAGIFLQSLRTHLSGVTCIFSPSTLNQYMPKTFVLTGLMLQ